MDRPRSLISVLWVVFVPSHDQSIVREVLGKREEHLKGTDDLNSEDILGHFARFLPLLEKLDVDPERVIRASIAIRYSTEHI